MQHAISLEVDGRTLRGMEHVPARNNGEQVPAVILFHGFTGTKLEPHRLFWKVSRALEAVGVASFRFDFSGSGESDGHFEDMTVSQEIREAGAILDFVRQDPRIDRDRISLLGLSLGGVVASILAADRPGDVHRLALLAPAGNIRDIVMMMARDISITSDTRVYDHGGNLVGMGFAEDVAVLDPYQRASAYTGPVLIVQGTADVTVPRQVAERYRDEVYSERAQLHLIEGANHTFDRSDWETDLIGAVVNFVRP